jgi:multiple antibiotic resistance protein
MFKNILLAFIPVFVAVDAIGILPIFISVTKNLDEKERKQVLLQSTITAATLAIVFIFVGKVLFKALGITVGDFMIAGGFILFSIAILEILAPGRQKSMIEGGPGAVPLGTPLIAGPGVLTTCLIIVDQYGVIPTLISVVLNVAIAGAILYFSGTVIKILGKPGTSALSKIMALLLAAIAVMMIRKGVLLLLTGG